MTFGLLLLGFALGLLFIIPPGPVTVTLVEVGLTQGRSAGVRSALGVAAGDVVVAFGAGTVVVAGAALPGGLFGALRTASAAALIGIGVLLVARPGVAETVAEAIERPGRTFFLMTVLTPTVFGAWVALLASLPFAGQGRALLVFVVGACLASLAWHLVLGAGAGGFGHRLDPRTIRIVARIGGVSMMALGLLATLR